MRRPKLEAAGFQVVQELETEPVTYRSFAQKQEDKRAKQKVRARHLVERAERLEARLVEADKKVEQVRELVPPMGQPILVGHHSEARHRRSLDRLDQAIRFASELREEAHLARQAANRAVRESESGYGVAYVHNKLVAARRDLRRVRQGLVSVASWRVAELEEEVEYWEQEQQKLTEGRPVYSRETVQVGDMVASGRLWWEVARVNAKTVSVWSDKEAGVTSSYRLPYEKITGLVRL